MGKVVNIKKASGRNVSESERNTERLTLRMLPANMRKLETLAKRWKCTHAEVIATLLVNEIGAS